MTYVEKNLMQGESIVYQTKLNKLFAYQWSLALAALGFCILLFNGNWGIITLFIAGIIALAPAVTVATSEFAVTNKRVIIKVGLIRIRSIETMLHKIESVQVHQGILDRLVNSGTIVVRGSGGTQERFEGIDGPQEFRRCINEQIAVVSTPIAQ